MNLQEITQVVVDATARPDRLAYIRTAVNSVCRTIGAMQDVHHDLVEEVIDVDPNVAIHELLRPAGMRKVQYLKDVNMTHYISPTSARQVFKGGREQTDVYYLNATSIMVRLKAPTELLKIGYYRYPEVLTLDTDSNWLTDIYGSFIADMVIGRVLRLTGDPKSADALESIASAELQSLLTSSTIEGVNSVLRV